VSVVVEDRQMETPTEGTDFSAAVVVAVQRQ
jgi:hypothetical protein